MTLVYIFIGMMVVFIVVGFIGQLTAEPLPSHLSDEVIRQLAQQGKKIQAIKGYRQLHGTGLKEAKKAVEAMINS